MLGLTVAIIYISTKSEEKQTIAVMDPSGLFVRQLDTNSKTFSFLYLTSPQSKNNKEILNSNHADILLQIYASPNTLPDSIHLYKEGGVGLNAKSFISDALNAVYQTKQLTDAGLHQGMIDSIQNSELDIRSFDLKSNKETNSEIAMAIGYVSGFLLYFILIIYGVGVMRGVTEEKTNRIAEVIISSVKPFELMMGKIFGIALVGLTQFALWLLVSLALQLLLPMFIPSLTDITSMTSLQPGASNVASHEMAGIWKTIVSQNWGLIIGCFLFYFLGGYFLYASMFAAVGSMVNEDPQEAQQLTFPITLPIIFAMFILVSAIQDPNSTLSIFGSIFPLTSPIVMMGRIPYGIPAWQLIVSMLCLILGFIGMTWLSAKIYRTGILMYGKKSSWKEVWKWLLYR